MKQTNDRALAAARIAYNAAHQRASRISMRAWF